MLDIYMYVYNNFIPPFAEEILFTKKNIVFNIQKHIMAWYEYNDMLWVTEIFANDNDIVWLAKLTH